MGNSASKIWYDATFDPVTGCYCTCDYCNAKRIATKLGGADELDESKKLEKLMDTHVIDKPLQKTDSNGHTEDAPYPFGFEPTFHKYRLDGLKDITGKNILVCSAGDLFGPWVPDSWIEAVFDACLNAPGHRYLFLTQFPYRYVQLGRSDRLPAGDEFWYGTTITNPDAPAFWSRDHHTFTCIEPILMPFDVECGITSFLGFTEWVILGAETGIRKQKVKPEFWWIERTVEQIAERGIPLYMENSMKQIWDGKLTKQFPW